MRLTATIATFTVVATITVSAALANNYGTGGKQLKKPPKLSYYESAKRAVCHYFKTSSECYTAMKIVKCETGGTYWPWVSNGQYQGIFQMGSNERATYGHGNNVWAQAKAAYAYYKAAGGFYDPWLKWQPPGCGN